jgi:hypothetical protein
LKNNKEVCNKFGYEFVIENFDVKPGHCISGDSDLIRVTNAATKPRIMYVDWDCKILSLPESFDANKPLVGKWGDKIDIWGLYNGDRTDLFQTLLEKIGNAWGSWGVYFHYLNSDEFRKNLDLFSDDCLQHVSIGTGTAIRPK